MSDSSTEKSVDEAEVEKTEAEPQKEPKKVPVEAVAKERAEKRAARAEADELRKDKAQRDSFDDSLIETLTRQAKEAVDREMQPIMAENARLKMAVDYGLTGEQSEKVMELQQKNPGLKTEQCLVLARTENPDLFPTQSAPANDVPAYLRGLPTGGDSQIRTGADQKDHFRLMQEARAKGDVHGAKMHAMAEFERRFQALRNPAR